MFAKMSWLSISHALNSANDGRVYDHLSEFLKGGYIDEEIHGASIEAWIVIGNYLQNGEKNFI